MLKYLARTKWQVMEGDKQKRWDRPMRRWMFPMLLALIPPLTARAEGYSADNLPPHCKAPDQFCTGYLLAVVDAENEKAVGKQFCLHKDLDVDVVNSASGATRSHTLRRLPIPPPESPVSRCANGFPASSSLTSQETRLAA